MQSLPQVVGISLRSRSCAGGRRRPRSEASAARRCKLLTRGVHSLPHHRVVHALHRRRAVVRAGTDSRRRRDSRHRRRSAPGHFAGLMVGLPGLALALTCIVTFTFRGTRTPAQSILHGGLLCEALTVWFAIDVSRCLVCIVGFALFYRSAGSALYSSRVHCRHAHIRRAVHEEPTLRQTFGHDYDAYLHRTGRWWPFRGYDVK